MDVRPGHCWRCEQVLPQQTVPCGRCPMAMYCTSLCQGRDKIRHGAVECKIFRGKTCSCCHILPDSTSECSGCNNAWYCNKQCQRRDWPAHRTSCKKITAFIKLLSMELTNRLTYGDFPYYFGNTMARDFLQLEHNEWSKEGAVEEQLGRDFHILSAGCGDLRNTVLTAGSLPDRYKGKLHITLNDYDPFVMARNVLFLFMLVRFADTDYIASSLTTIWYSLHLSKREYDLIKTSLDELIQMTAQQLHDATKGLVSVLDDDLIYLHHVWTRWRLLECQRDKAASINLGQQRKDLFENSDYNTKADRPLYLCRVNEKDRKLMEKWFAHGLFLPAETKDRDMPFDNPTLTAPRASENVAGSDARLLLLMGYSQATTGDGSTFVYCVHARSIPFLAWDCLRVRELTSGSSSSPMVMYHNYVTNLLQNVKNLIIQGRLRVQVSLANCLNFHDHHQTLNMPNYDRILTSNLADYIGIPRLLQTFKPLLNASNSFSVIVTETMNWYKTIPAANVKSLPQSQIEEIIIAYCLDTSFKISPKTKGINNNSIIEYYDNTSHFLQYLRADIMAGGPGIPVLKEVPSFSSVKNYHGMQMRDFRKGLNRLVPFLCRVNKRDLNVMNVYDRAVEWCLPNSSS